VKISPPPVSILLVMPSGPGLLSLFRAHMASWVSLRWKGSAKSGSVGAVARRSRILSVPILFASASSYGDSVCPWRGWLRAKRYWCQERGFRERGPSFQIRRSLEAFSLTSLGREDWKMIVFVSLQVVPHGSVRSLWVLVLWLGDASVVEELVIPFLRT
jgi:hypothetical protein